MVISILSVLVSKVFVLSLSYGPSPSSFIFAVKQMCFIFNLLRPIGHSFHLMSDKRKMTSNIYLIRWAFQLPSDTKKRKKKKKKGKKLIASWESNLRPSALEADILTI